MITLLKNKLTVLLLATVLMVPLLTAGLAPTSQVFALNSKDAACEGVGLGNSPDCGSAAAGTKLSGIVGNIVKILSIVVGVAAVIMIIIAGFKYITSGGESSKIASAKSTLIYAIIGLFIVALAQFIVHFVLTNT